MNSNFILSSERSTINWHASILPSQVQAKASEPSVILSSNLTRLERSRLVAQEFICRYFKDKNHLINDFIEELKSTKIHVWLPATSNKKNLINQNIKQIALKKLLKDFELIEYLQICRKKFKENFQSFYLRIHREQEELKKSQLKQSV